jgi:DNA repair exonuclease SbcCD ATPase subunit
MDPTMEELSTMPLDQEIDQLYQLKPEAFTAARNELVKLLPASDRVAVKTLQKPTVPAWAVNQLYWQRRRAFKALVDAAERLRTAHAQQLAGRHPDIQAAERDHRDALKAAADEIREILKEAGEPASHQTMNAVTETLQALPGRADYGRLTKPLKPLGFEALSGLVRGGGATIARLADKRPPMPPPKPPAARSPADDKAAAKREAEAKKREQAEARRQAAERDRELRTATAEARTAAAELSRAEMALARVQRERKDLQTRLDELTSRRDELALEVDQKKKAAERASGEVERLKR